MSIFNTYPVRNELKLTFGYDEEVIDIVRAISGRRWDAKEKRWYIPASQIHALAAGEKALMRKRAEVYQKLQNEILDQREPSEDGSTG